MGNVKRYAVLRSWAVFQTICQSAYSQHFNKGETIRNIKLQHHSGHFNTFQKMKDAYCAVSYHSLTLFNIFSVEEDSGGEGNLEVIVD